MISELIWRDESSRAESAIAIAAQNKYSGRSLILGGFVGFARRGTQRAGKCAGFIA
jgi:hypothetical protein